jgi:glycosyltransferase involved in cell wall biosynthesis
MVEMVPLTAAEMNPPVNLAVPGKFHVFNYAAILIEKGYINRLYCSHKSSTLAKNGLASPPACNFPLKEYLVRAHGKYLRKFFYEEAMPHYTRMWARQVANSWAEAPLLHHLSTGGVGPMLAAAARSGTKVIAEAINTHPANRRLLLHEDARRWGLQGCGLDLAPRERMIVEEVGAASLVLCPTEVVARSYRTRGIPAERLVTIPYAANVQAFGRLEPQPSRAGDPLKVICVGAIGLRKGQFYLLEAARRLGPRAVHLTLVGVIDPQVERVLDKYKDTFTWIERVPGPDMPALLASQDVFVSASLEEGLAVSICEAMASGLAVIGTETSGAPELVEDGVTGLVVAPGSSESLFDALSRVVEDRRFRLRLASAARASAALTHNWEGYAGALMKLYDHALGHGPRA